MAAFIIKIVIAVALFLAARHLYRKAVESQGNTTRNDLMKLLGFLARGVAILFVVWAFIGTSLVWVTSGHIATLKRVYFGTSLEPGQIVAHRGQLGPQAEILTAGFHLDPFITLVNEVEYHPVFTVPPNQCAIMSAKDGKPIPGGSAFAEPWSDAVRHKMANNAEFFLREGNGQRGPQSTVLGPGSYTINPYLWENPRLIPATRVEQGTVGVVKSSVLADVDFGPFRRPKPASSELKILTSSKLPKAAAQALLVPVGAIGVWEEALPNGLYYINTDAYKLTMVPATAQVYEYRGGYKKRMIEIALNDEGKITERTSELEVQEVKDAADKAIFTKPEGWDVPQELRVLAQVSPEMAPFVVASIGLTQANASQVIEDRVVTPIIRSVVRDVIGGKQIPFVQTKAKLDEKTGKPIVNAQGETITEVVHGFRPVAVLDLIENRSSIEDAIESDSRPEALKEGISILEVRLSESAIPPELLIARKREQLAQQLTKAWAQEEIAQTQRQKTEAARAQATQQSTFVAAEIDARAATERAKGRIAEGNAEKEYLVAIAAGNKAQADVLGGEETAKLQMFTQMLKLVSNIAEKNPDILVKGLENAAKFVPSVVVSNNGGNGTGSSGSLEGAAAIFAHLMSGGLREAPKPPMARLEPAKAVTTTAK